ncbi:MAG: phosphate ABC transporter, permease protein PstA, partial [Alphaproteobacteria bacterium]|nr:phosphate ABC transporter, permease protein PstA [Alphaproteobacteria bacterium]
MTEPATARAKRAVRTFTADVSAVGEPNLWMLGGALAFGIILIVGFLALVLWNGLVTFWPKPVHVVTLVDGQQVAGESVRHDTYRVGPELLAKLPPQARAAVAGAAGHADRTLYRIGNYDLYNEDFRWVSDFEVAKVEQPPGLYFFERQEWGPFIGRIAGITLAGTVADPAVVDFESLRDEQMAARARFEQIRRIERVAIGAVNQRIERERLALRRIELDGGTVTERYRTAAGAAAPLIAALGKEYDTLAAEAATIRAEDKDTRITLADISGRTRDVELSQIVRFYPANALSLPQKLAVYLGRWLEFLTTEPREANTEGGILPAIFGTVAMTLIMVVIVAPFGVVTALYLREYARQGRLVAAVRISVNNLAGVPSIVYGVFGLGFFAYTLGVSIDQLFFPERLPNPTFG